MNIREGRKTASIRPGQLSVRRQRIERWAYKGRNASMSKKVIRSSASLGTSLIQKRAESSLFQADRHLNMELFQLGEARDKFLERTNFDQKLFANKQALLHKDNQDILRTLDYVRKCCKYSNKNDNEEEFLHSTIVFEEGSSNTITQTNPEKLEYNNKHIQSSDDQENSKRHVQFQMNTKRGSQSAHASRKSHSSTDNQRIQSAHEILTINFAPPVTIIDPTKGSIKPSLKPKRSSSKNSLQEFRRYPERFLSKTNRYLPLLRRQATESQSTLDGFDLAYDDAKSFLSEEIAEGKTTIHSQTKLRAPNKINLMETLPEDNSSEYKITLSRLRDREYGNLQKLIHSNSIEHILQPFSPTKTLKPNLQQSMNLHEILQSNDSLHSSNKHKPNKMNIEKNLSKLGILIF